VKKIVVSPNFSIFLAFTQPRPFFQATNSFAANTTFNFYGVPNIIMINNIGKLFLINFNFLAPYIPPTTSRHHTGPIIEEID